MKNSRIPICVVIGTRPEAVKMHPVIRALGISPYLRPIVIATGQQRELLRLAMSDLCIQPDADLDIMVSQQTLAGVTSAVVNGVHDKLKLFQPRAVLVHGDTTTALASALAAFYARIPTGHVEAGLRTYNFDAPWPEEMNRRLIDPICHWCFAPTTLARENLLSERIPASKVFVTGNTVVDSLLETIASIESAGMDMGRFFSEIGMHAEFINSLCAAEVRARIILVTGHRRESFGEGFKQICKAIISIADKHPNTYIIYPVHLNPNVREPVSRLLKDHHRIQLIEPVPYAAFVRLMKHAHIILTDSGGVQEEAPTLGKPVLVMRETTERPEAVMAGTAQLVGTNADNILASASRLLDDSNEYERRSSIRNPYGDGSASKRIVGILEEEFASSSSSSS